MSDIIRVGIVGLGRSGRDIHGKHLSRARRKFKIVAVTDRLAPRRQRAEAEYGCRSYATPESLLAQDDIDLVVNASQTQYHVPLTLKALKAGFHVLCEKPLARKAEEVDKIIRASRRAGRVAAAFQNRRYDADFQQVVKVVNSGVLGRIVMIKTAINGFSRRWDWQTLRKHSGGSLLNTGPHVLDQALQLFGTDTRPEVTCIMDRATSLGDAEDHVKLLLLGRGRPTIDVEISSCCAYPQERFNVYGTRGGLQADGSGGVRWRYFLPREQPRQTLKQTPIENEAGLPAYCREDLKWRERDWHAPAKRKSIDAQYYDMLHRALTTGAPLEVTLPEIRQQIAVIEECHRQNPPGKMPGGD
jgi:scyllo-inositol 2-dehydrogenase (NADP+)